MRQIALGTAVTGLITLLSTAAWAQEPARPRIETTTALAGVSLAAPAATRAQDPGDPMRNFTVSFGADVPSDYYFRGIIQEYRGVIVQPWVDVGFNFSDSVSLNVGWWNSAHSSGAAEGLGTNGLYESDPYVGLSFGGGAWSAGVLYTFYTFPFSSEVGTVHELAFSVSHDSIVAPSVTLAVELNNALFPDDPVKGNTYLEFAVEPSVPMSGPVGVSFPVAVGLSLKNYYFNFDEEEEDFTSTVYGYTKAGVAVGVELPAGFEVHGGVDVLFLGADSLHWDFDTDGDPKKTKVVPHVGFSWSF